MLYFLCSLILLIEPLFCQEFDHLNINITLQDASYSTGDVNFFQNTTNSLNVGNSNDSNTHPVSMNEVRKAIHEALLKVKRMAKAELKNVVFLKKINATPQDALEFDMKIKMGFVSTFASTELAKMMARQNMSKSDIVKTLNAFDMTSTAMEWDCPYTKSRIDERPCNPLYREIDGYCNNLKYPLRGTTHYPAQRYLPADYGDGVNSPRVGNDGQPLPNPRIISSRTLPSNPVPNPTFTNMIMVFGLLMDHEFALVSSPTGFKFGDIKCCLEENKKNPMCMAMEIPQNDTFFSQYNARCMEAVRAAPVIGRDCRLGHRHQNNEVTSYIDASTVYGSTPDIASLLRTFEGGTLKMQPHMANPRLRSILPVANISFQKACLDNIGPFRCFAAGEERVNENSILAVMHTLFAREHNRVANRLAAVNNRWNDEKIYQEARRIVAAEIQHITYNEFLPIVIGTDTMERYGLTLKSRGYFDGYDPEFDATVDHGFATSAYRFGHSLINKDMFRVSRENLLTGILTLRQNFFQPQHIYQANLTDGIDTILRGFFRQSSQRMDNHIVEDVRNHLFKLPNETHGMDLMALNMIRSREQGVPSYNKWREFCNFTQFPSFVSMYTHMQYGAVNRLSSAYRHPNDIDLFIGGVSELSRGSKGLLGPTFSCILGTQFRNFKYGDRYWYENGRRNGTINYPFTPRQLSELRKVTMSRIVCDNSDTITQITRNTFRTRNEMTNPQMSCNQIPAVNFQMWRSSLLGDN